MHNPINRSLCTPFKGGLCTPFKEVMILTLVTSVNDCKQRRCCMFEKCSLDVRIATWYCEGTQKGITRASLGLP